MTTPNQHGHSPLTVALAAVGALILLVVMTFVGIGAWNASRVRDYDPQYAAADGVTRLEILAVISELTVRCDPAATQFTLEQRDVTEQWHLKSDGGTVSVTRDPHFGLQGFFSFRGPERITLTLPNVACDGSLDAHINTDAGSVKVDADFNKLELDVDAGEAVVQGNATTLDAEVGAGSLRLDGDIRQRADLTMHAGEVEGEMAVAPQRLNLDVSAGSINLALPAADYAVTSNVSAGDFNNALKIDSSGPASKVDVKVDAGDVSLTTR